MLDSSYERAPRRDDQVGVRTHGRTGDAADRLWLQTGAAGDDWYVQDLTHRVTGRGEDRYDALRDLQSALAPDTSLSVCANCCFFEATGMSRQMSDGAAGYCLVNFPSHGRSLADVVAIFDYCDCYTHCAEPATDELRLRLWKERASGTDGRQ